MSQLFATQPVLKGKAIALGLFITNAGAGADPAFAPGDVKLSKNGAALANATNLPAKIAGAAAGAHLFTLAAADTDVAGPLLVQIVKGGVDTLVAYVDVTTGELAIFSAIIEGPDQVDGGGEAGTAQDNITFAQALREMLADASGNATGLEGPQAIVKSRKGGRNRVVFALANGNRTATSRDNS